MNEYIWIVKTCLKSVILLIVIFWLLKILWSRRKFYKLSYQLPGPFALPLVGNGFNVGFFSAQNDVINVLKKMRDEYGGIFRIWLGPEFSILLSDCDDIECILLSKQAAWKGPQYDVLSTVIGKSLLAGSGSVWKAHRYIINPSFNGASNRSYQIFHEKHGKILTKNLKKICNNGFVDVQMHTLRWAADVIIESLFECEANFHNGNKDDVLNTTVKIGKLIHARMTKPWLQNDVLFNITTTGNLMKKYLKIYRDYYHETLKEKFNEYLKIENWDEKTIIDNKDYEAASKTQKTTFKVLADALYSKNITMSEILDAFDNIWNAGLDTCYTHMSFFILMMGMHKRCQNLVWTEIKNIFGNDLDAPVTTEIINKMPYLDMCLKEVSRLFPTGPIQTRTIHEDFFLKSKNLLLPKGTTVLLSNLLLHRNPKYWQEPNSYIPERFLPENCVKRPHFAYIPFSSGLRNCIGQIFGYDMLKTATIHLLRNLEFESDLEMKDIVISSDISTRCAQGYNVKIKERDRNVIIAE